MATVATVPQYAVPGRATSVVFTLTESGSNYLRAWVTTAPLGSELANKLKDESAGRLEIYTGDGGPEAPHRVVFDRGGVYTLVIQEYARGASAYGGGYQGSPASAPSETKVGSEQTRSVYVGQRMTSQVGTGGDTATLVLWVWNDTIRSTTLASHGEKTPVIVAETPTARVSNAISTAAVTTALNALVNQTVATALGNVPGHFQDVINTFNQHIAYGAVHGSADTANEISADYRSPAPEKRGDAINAIVQKFLGHFGDDDGTGFGAADYHDPADLRNSPLITSVDQETSFSGIAELWRAYEAHRLDSSVHAGVDSIHTLAALPPLLELHRQFFAALASSAATTPVGQSSGAANLIRNAGFSESPLETS